MRKILFILVLLAIVSCKKDSDPAPPADLTSDLVGKFVFSYAEKYMGIDIEFRTEWEIQKVSESKIRIKHFQKENIKSPGWEDVYEPSEPFETTLDDIELTRADRFKLDRTVDWPYDGEMQKSHLIIDAVLVGRDLDVKVTETTLSDNDTTEDRLKFIRQ